MNEQHHNHSAKPNIILYSITLSLQLNRMYEYHGILF